MYLPRCPIASRLTPSILPKGSQWQLLAEPSQNPIHYRSDHVPFRSFPIATMRRTALSASRAISATSCSSPMRKYCIWVQCWAIISESYGWFSPLGTRSRREFPIHVACRDWQLTHSVASSQRCNHLLFVPSNAPRRRLPRSSSTIPTSRRERFDPVLGSSEAQQCSRLLGSNQRQDL